MVLDGHMAPGSEFQQTPASKGSKCMNDWGQQGGGKQSKKRKLEQAELKKVWIYVVVCGQEKVTVGKVNRSQRDIPEEYGACLTLVCVCGSNLLCLGTGEGWLIHCWCSWATHWNAKDSVADHRQHILISHHILEENKTAQETDKKRHYYYSFALIMFIIISLFPTMNRARDSRLEEQKLSVGWGITWWNEPHSHIPFGF